MTDLPYGWVSKPLSEVLEESIGGIWGSEPGSAEVDVSVLRVTEMKADGRLEPSTAARRSVSAKQVASRELRVGDIILEKSGGGPKSPVGRVGIIDSTTAGYLFSNFMQLLRPATETVQPDFLFQYLVYFQATGQTAPMQTATTNIRNIKMPDYLASGVPLPPLAEQQRIVEILEEQFSRLDAALASIRTVREKAAAFRRSLLQAAFHGALAGDSAVSIPSDWSLLSLDEVSEVRLGRQRSPRNHSGPQMRPYLRAANVTWQGLDLTDVKEMNFSDEELRVLCLKSGDILVGEASGSPNEVGKAAVFQGEIENCCFQNTLLRVRPLSIDTRYLHYFLTGTAMSGAYARESRGVGISHLGRAKLASWPVPVAPAPEQQRIGEMLDEQFSRLDAALVVANQLEARFASERRSILHAAFAGTLTAQWRETNHG